MSSPVWNRRRAKQRQRMEKRRFPMRFYRAAFGNSWYVQGGAYFYAPPFSLATAPIVERVFSSQWAEIGATEQPWAFVEHSGNTAITRPYLRDAIAALNGPPFGREPIREPNKVTMGRGYSYDARTGRVTYHLPAEEEQ